MVSYVAIVNGKKLKIIVAKLSIVDVFCGAHYAAVKPFYSTLLNVLELTDFDIVTWKTVWVPKKESIFQFFNDKLENAVLLLAKLFLFMTLINC